MSNENKWEYDYSNIYHKPAQPTSYANVGSSGTNAANQPEGMPYYTQPSVEPSTQETVPPISPASQAAPISQTPPVQNPDAYATASGYQTAAPSGAVNGMPPPPPQYVGGNAAGTTRTARAKQKNATPVSRGLCAVAFLALVGMIGFAGGYYGSVYGTVNGDNTVLVQQVIRDTSDATTLSTSTDGNDLSVVSAASLASKSVVVITTEQMVATSGWYGTQSVESGAGSGVIISDQGYILTCAHVVNDASNIIVTIGEEDYLATVVGSDEETDVAVIKIDAVGLTPAVLGDSDGLAIGEKILAVGNPLGVLGGSVTEGIVSALNRVIVVENYEMTLVQMDASVSPGNSGGGLFNMAGELVGIVNAKSKDSDSEGIGFAIPINTAFSLAKSLIENGYVTGRPELGIVALNISDAETAAGYGVNALGVYVYSINEGSAAEAAGLQVGDRLISIQDHEISALSDLTDVIDGLQVGDQVALLIAREGQMMTVTVTLGEQGAPSTLPTPMQPQTEDTTPNQDANVPGGTSPDQAPTAPEGGNVPDGMGGFPFNMFG